MIQLWSALAVAALTVIVAPILRGELSGRLLKRVAAHADLREKLDGNTAALKELDALLVRETATLREREEYRLTRKLNGGNVAALVFVALVGAVLVYLLVNWGLAALGTPLAIVLFILAGLVGLFTIGLAAVGLRTLYEPSKTRKGSK